MFSIKALTLTLMVAALTGACQTQSYRDESPTSSYSAQRLSSSQPIKAQSPEVGAKANASAVVISTGANLRETPNKYSSIVLELKTGVALSVLEEKTAGPWYKVRHVAFGKAGWVHGNTIKLTVDSTPPPVEESLSGSGVLPPAQTRRGSSRTTVSGDTYINSFGEEVPRPRRSSSVPDGASARCRDGTYSFSRSRRGTCSHHGGVAEWL